MRIRSFPFGYRMENGMIILHEQEAPIVGQIFSRYLQGLALSAIADEMDIPYSEASPKWDKCKVKRLLDNRRYMGEEGYPALISAADFDAVQHLKSERNTSKPAAVPCEIQHIRPRLYCQTCGSRIRRQSRPYGERWICTAGCGSRACLRSSDLIQRTIACMDAIISNPDALWSPHEIQPPSLAVTRLQNEWQREMGRVHPDGDRARSLLFQLTAEKYADIDDTPQVTLGLRKAFAGCKPIGEFNVDLFDATVEKVLAGADGAIALRLKNGQVLSERG